MTPRWLACVVVGLATQAVYAQTAPVASPEYEDAEEVDSTPMAPSPPPALPQEAPSPRPFAGAVWTSGHWFWDGGEWRFKPGAWIAPMAGYQFINGYWQQEGGAWRWVTSGWARAGSTQVEIPIDVVNEEVASSQPPPALQAEVRPPPPSANVTWAPGYWYWSGTGWDWIEGSWVAPPRPGLAYVSPRWVRRGPSWVFVGGGWATRGSFHIVVPVYRHSGIAVRWGHPNYFLHSWHRYPMVHRYYGGRGWRAPAPQRYHPASPVREHRRGWREHQGSGRVHQDGRREHDDGRREHRGRGREHRGDDRHHR